MKYDVLHGPEIAPGEPQAERATFGDVILLDRLRTALARINPTIPAEAREEALRKVTLAETPSLVENNRRLHKLLTEGVDVEYRRPDNSIAGDKVWLIDFDTVDNNEFLAVNQFTVVEDRHTRRTDVVVFVNGLPLAVLELKNATDENATTKGAFQQLQTYKQEIPSLFAGPWFQWMRNLTCCWLIARQEQLTPAFVLTYADGPGLPMAEKIAGRRSAEWTAFTSQLRQGVMCFKPISFQQLVGVAEKAVADVAGDVRAWQDLSQWVQRKITDVCGMKRLQA